MSNNVKMIKSDAIVTIEIGTGFLQKIQKIFLYLAKDITSEQLALYKELSEKKEPFTEEWMDHLMTITILLKEIEDKAVEQGWTYDGELPNLENN